MSILFLIFAGMWTFVAGVHVGSQAGDIKMCVHLTLFREERYVIQKIKTSMVQLEWKVCKDLRVLYVCMLGEVGRTYGSTTLGGDYNIIGYAILKNWG